MQWEIYFKIPASAACSAGQANFFNLKICLSIVVQVAAVEMLGFKDMIIYVPVYSLLQHVHRTF